MGPSLCFLWLSEIECSILRCFFIHWIDSRDYHSWQCSREVNALSLSSGWYRLLYSLIILFCQLSRSMCVKLCTVLRDGQSHEGEGEGRSAALESGKKTEVTTFAHS
jgi:hypothetical protein